MDMHVRPIRNFRIGPSLSNRIESADSNSNRISKLRRSLLIFVLNCITGSNENYASHCSELSQLHQQPVDAVICPTFIGKLCYKLPSVVTFTFIQTFDQNFVFFTERRHVDRQCDAYFSKFALFCCVQFGN